jgi:GRIM-19 protein
MGFIALERVIWKEGMSHFYHWRTRSFGSQLVVERGLCHPARHETWFTGSGRMVDELICHLLGPQLKGETKLIWTWFVFRELQREKIWSRIHLVPLLMAEGDRDAYRREQAALAREKEIMKDVKGWKVSWPLWGPYDMALMMLIDCELYLLSAFYLLAHQRSSGHQAGKSVYNSSRYRSPEIVIL